MWCYRALAALVLSLAATGAFADDAKVTPLFSYVGDLNGVVAGGAAHVSSYVHTASAGLQVPVAGHWSVTVQGAWTAGSSLSAKAIGDVQGVQGPFNTGDGLWLYELKVAYAGDNSSFQAGRISTGDIFPGVSGMSEFVNSAFSSNGGAISLNDPGRATSPASTWGASGKLPMGGGEVRAGVFLSDPYRTTLAKHGLDLAFKPSDGVLAYGEILEPIGAGLKVGVGAYGDSAHLTTFDSRPVRGNEGYYLWLERPAPDKGEAVSGFAMVQGTPHSDRDLEPLSMTGGLTWRGFNSHRPDDSVSLGAESGHFSHDSGLSGWESTLEANYKFKVNGHLALRPDVEYVIAPGGRSGGSNALVVGLQVEAGL